MDSSKFIFTWQKKRESGILLYTFKYVISILIASVIGKVIGDYIRSRIFIKTFGIQDYK